eukprot:CAMPEP_0170580806 /NCGR_PEP_ID=MMETSP0224-20130122/6702_1 /TAXON_ID=285029 /ORGANISM="Togula jolla, Strain CCCM 725" /LENGTH=144 /DNA_ID=CAMNT_0010903899 /DNA_START=2236 /DNA_END=2670 /DNA_ORIENTATION=+
MPAGVTKASAPMELSTLEAFATDYAAFIAESVALATELHSPLEMTDVEGNLADGAALRRASVAVIAESCAPARLVPSQSCATEDTVRLMRKRQGLRSRASAQWREEYIVPWPTLQSPSTQQWSRPLKGRSRRDCQRSAAEAQAG